jgi:essential nuclear protein 1
LPTSPHAAKFLPRFPTNFFQDIFPSHSVVKMPKSPKFGRNDRPRPVSLAQEYSPYQQLKQKAPKKRKQRDDDDLAENVVDSKASRKIISLGQDLADEDQAERQARYVSGANQAFLSDPRLGLDAEYGDEADDDEYGEWEDEDNEQLEAEVCAAMMLQSIF